MNITELEQNIGKRCKVMDSPIAGLTGREATIKGVSGDQREGFRYHIELDEPLFSFLTKTDYYPPVFLVEIL